MWEVVLAEMYIAGHAWSKSLQAVVTLNAQIFAGTLTKNEMAVTKAWIAGKYIEDIGKYGQHASNGSKPGLSSLLDSKVADTLNKAIALNCTASFREQETGTSAA